MCITALGIYYLVWVYNDKKFVKQTDIVSTKC